jgi:hypothetical protein
MSVQTLTFVLSDAETGLCVGHALIGPDARYAAIAWQGVEQIERRSVHPADWKLLDQALHQGLLPRPLERTHIAVRILLPADRRDGIVVQYLAGYPLGIPPSHAAEEFDAQLTSMAGAVA